MQFGKTTKQLKKEKYNKEHKPKEKWFCWYPVQLDDGKMVWLETIDRHTIPHNRGHKGTTHKWIYTSKDIKGQ